jgi:chemotaxis protein MotA
MIALLGLGVVVVSVLGGFTLAGGKVPALFHISEVLIVGGTALGTVLVSTPGGILKSLVSNISLIIRPTPFNKVLYLDALKLLFELFQMAQRDGLVAIESHIEAPQDSTLFQKYPNVLRQRSAVTFFCDSLRLVLLGSVPPHDLEALMDAEIDVHHEQESRPVSTLQKVSDALPGIGIVAAVLGVVVTMGAIDGPIEEIGEHVAAALTGTFMGVLLAYGFVGPMATGLEHVKAAEVRFLHFLKASIVATAKGSTPIVAAEFARRAIFSEVRPSFIEMETAFKELKRAARGQ